MLMHQLWRLVSKPLHSVLSHLDNSDTYARMLFLYFSSAFNTLIPSKLITKLTDLGITPLICNWLLNFLTNRPQHVRLDHRCSSILTINTGKPHGCVLSLFLSSLFTHYCRPVHSSIDIIKFADDITVIGLIRNNDELAFGEEVERLAMWCETINCCLTHTKQRSSLWSSRGMPPLICPSILTVSWLIM